MTAETKVTSKKSLKYPHGKNPNSLANLAIGQAIIAERRKNGEPQNPVGYSLTSALKHSLGKKVERPPDDAPARDLIVYQTIQGALKREPTSQNIVWDRSDGKVAGDTSEVNQDNRSINFIIVGEGGEELVKGIARRLTGATE